MKIMRRPVARCFTASNALTLSACLSVTLLFAQASSVPASLGDSTAKLPDADSKTAISYKLIDAPQHTLGYDVFADGKLMIHQTSAPALSGNEGFKTKEDATKVALLVIKKIKKGEMPPTISIDELKQLKVIK